MSNNTNVPSIRSIILTDIRNNVPKAETAAKIANLHGSSMAHEKFSKHYGWYKAWNKKNPVKVETVTE